MLATEGRSALPEEKFNEVNSLHTVENILLHFSYMHWVLTERHNSLHCMFLIE
jgi:hypothetical protein